MALREKPERKVVQTDVYKKRVWDTYHPMGAVQRSKHLTNGDDGEDKRLEMETSYSEVRRRVCSTVAFVIEIVSFAFVVAMLVAFIVIGPYTLKEEIDLPIEPPKCYGRVDLCSK